jgi:endonuclease YncB( thermonuclease family)
MAPWFVRILLGVAGGVLWAAPVLACDLPAGETATVASVQDGETLSLTDGRTVRLLGIKAPSPPLGWKGEDPWPFVAEAKDALSKLTSGAVVELRFDERRSDRYSHVLAQVYVVRGETKTWVQGALIAEGLARVYSFADTRACVGELLESETTARAARRGIWHSWAYRVQDASDVKRLGRLTHTYQLVEGTVHAVGEGRRWIYVNFAEDWRHDFTIAIARKDLAVFETAGFDLERLAGARVRVRGWVEWWNGPMIKATHPEQIEVLTPLSTAG